MSLDTTHKTLILITGGICHSSSDILMLMPIEFLLYSLVLTLPRRIHGQFNRP